MLNDEEHERQCASRRRIRRILLLPPVIVGHALLLLALNGNVRGSVGAVGFGFIILGIALCTDYELRYINKRNDSTRAHLSN